jgi:CO dehydrogenase/acetyl-CoA synthase gamma subunit (corrinoid Fe-S protein)
LKDRKVAPEVVEITIGGQSKRVTIVGENDVFKPIYYLENGSLLPKNYKIFNELPTPRKEKTQKEKYDEMKAREKLKR